LREPFAALQHPIGRRRHLADGDVGQRLRPSSEFGRQKGQLITLSHLSKSLFLDIIFIRAVGFFGTGFAS
jgi:hypothetical protein